MSRFGPTVDEERMALLLRGLQRASRAELLSDPDKRHLDARVGSPWRSFSPIVRFVLFVLTSICVAAFAWLLDELHLPYGLLTLAAAIALAEFLIQSRKLFRAGADEALWLGACVALVISLPGSSRSGALLFFALAALVAGLRLRQSSFLTGSLVLTLCYFVSTAADDWVVEVVALTVGFVALALLTRRWRDPLVDFTLSGLVVVMPLFAYVAHSMESALDRSTIVIVAAAITAAGMIATGLSIRHHAPLVSGLIAAGIVLLEWGERSTWLLEWRLLAAGAALFTAGIFVLRLLRSIPYGFTSRSLAALEEFDLLQFAGASAMTVHVTDHEGAPAGLQAGGGSFGGGGASGDY